MMRDDNEDDAHVLTEVERLERDKSIMAGEIRRLAKNFLVLSSHAIPTLEAFTADPWIRFAKAMLTKHKKARR